MTPRAPASDTIARCAASGAHWAKFQVQTHQPPARKDVPAIPHLRHKPRKLQLFRSLGGLRVERTILSVARELPDRIVRPTRPAISPQRVARGDLAGLAGAPLAPWFPTAPQPTQDRSALFSTEQARSDKYHVQYRPGRKLLLVGRQPGEAVCPGQRRQIGRALPGKNRHRQILRRALRNGDRIKKWRDS
jgi:hypothetical protein